MNKVCKKHGKLSDNDIIKKGFHKSGLPAFRCGKCMKEIHAANYKKNKDKILCKTKEYREKNQEMVKQWKREFFYKNRERDRGKKRERDKRHHKNMIENLTDSYMKHLISKRSNIKYNDIPLTLIELKRTLLLSKKAIARNLLLNKEGKMK